MSTPFDVSTEQLLLPAGNLWHNINLRLFEPSARRATVICFHSYTGNSHDFDPLAVALAGLGFEVICPDMFGRGDSTHFGDPAAYGAHRTVEAAAAVISRRNDGPLIIVGIGWGAAIGLLASNVLKRLPGALVLCELPLRYRFEADPVVAQALSDELPHFPTLGDGMRHLWGTGELASLHADQVVNLGHRLRRAGRHYRLHYDPAILGAARNFPSRSYDIGAALPGPPTRTLLLYGQKPDEAARLSLDDFALTPGRAWTQLGLRSAATLRNRREIEKVVRFLSEDDPAS